MLVKKRLAEAEALASLGLTQAFEEFMSAREPITKDELISRLKASSPDDLSIAELAELLLNYAAGKAPYLVFTVSEF